VSLTNSSATMQGRRLTGRTVLLSFIAFFGTIFAVNGLMIHFAVKTFSGLETKNAYTAGLQYDRQIAAERAQDARGWKVEVTMNRASPGVSEITLTQRDAAGAPVPSLEAHVRLTHPADSHRDIELRLVETGPGFYRGSVEASPGRWVVMTYLQRRGETLFRSRNAVMIEDRAR